MQDDRQFAGYRYGRALEANPLPELEARSPLFK
jgi:hypothetical protein